MTHARLRAPLLALFALIAFVSGSRALQAQDDGFGGTFEPSWGEGSGADADYGGTFEPSWDDEEEAEEDGGGDDFGGTFEPSWDDEDDGGADDFGGTFEPSWDDEGDDGGDDFGGTFEPSWDDDEDDGADDFGGTFEPSWDAEEEADEDGADDDFGGTFEPSWDDEEEADEDGGGDDFGGTFEPTWDDAEDGADAPTADGADDGELTPDDDEYWLQWLDEQDEQAADEDEDVDWDEYWEVLEEPAPTEQVEVPSELAEGMGGVTGVVIDDEFGDPIPSVTVSIDETSDEVVTGEDGVFAFELEPGIYTLRARNFSYQPAAYEVEIEADTMTDMAQVRLTRDTSRTMTVVVEGRFDQASEATQLMERREATDVQDAVSAEQIARSGDSSASGAVRRVVGATIVDDRFLFVRGLGGQYTAVTLNGVPVPSTDPYYPGVELDLFPADLLSNLTIIKTGMADQPGTFTSGLMDIQTRTYPEEFTLSLGASISGDTQSTFQDQLVYDGGSLDLLGFDDGTRALPDSVPADEGLRVEDIFGNGLPVADIEQAARDLPNTWNYREATAPPGFGLKGTIGDTLQLGADELGYLFSLRYSSAFQVRTEDHAQLVGSPEQGYRLQRLPSETTGTQKSLWGALASLAWRPSDRHDVTLVSLWNQSSSDSTRVLQGFSQLDDELLRRWRLQYVARSMSFTELVGSHRRLLPSASRWHETAVTWYLAYARASRDEPYTRYMEQESSSDASAFAFRPNPGSGESFWSELTQDDLSAALDLSFPYVETFELNVGGNASYSRREFDARRLRFVYNGDDPLLLREDPESIFAEQNISFDSVFLREDTQATDSYVSTQRGASGYGVVEVQPTLWMRIIGGARYEVFVQDLEAASPVVDEDDAVTAERTDTDALPSGSLVFEVNEDMNVRAAYRMSVARPAVSAVAPFRIQDYVRRRTIDGNPELERTRIHNADLRWEWFPGPTEVLAATVFYKEFVDPYELVVQNAEGSTLQYENAEGATNYGAELEARFGLGHLSPALDDLSLGTNLLLVASRIDLPCTPLEGVPGECQENYTSTERPMEGQAPFVLNGLLTYAPSSTDLEVNLSYLMLGPVLQEVGLEGFPDFYQRTRHQLDLNASYGFNEHWSAKISLKNLLLNPVRVAAEDLVRDREQRPLSFSLSFGWSY